MENSILTPQPAPSNQSSNSLPQEQEIGIDDGMPELQSVLNAEALGAEALGAEAQNPIAVDLASQNQNQAPEINWTETETLSEEEEDLFMEDHGDSTNSFADEALVRNLMDLINPHEPSNVLNLITDLTTGSSQASYVSEFVGRILTGSTTSFSIAPSSSTSSALLPNQNQTKNVYDSLTGAPLPESAKVVHFQDGDVYEVDGLADFLITMQEFRSPATGRNLTEKELEKLAETQNAAIKFCLLDTLKTAKVSLKTIGSVKTSYFEETIYTMVLHCLSICELDQVVNAHSSILDFNKRFFPKTIRAFSGLSLANPTRLLKICSNVLSQLKSVLESVSADGLEQENITYLYHPVVLQSVCSALIGVCNLSSSQYFSSPSPEKFSAKICEVPVARIVQTQAISRIVSRRDT